MCPEVVQAQGEPLTAEDMRKKKLVDDLFQAQNKTIIEFAKHIVTVSIAAIGVELALKDKWLSGQAASRHGALILTIAISFFFLSAVICSATVCVQKIRVTSSDYENVDSELQRVASFRYRTTGAGVFFALLATCLTLIVLA
jgi:hypothetical protein